MPFPGDFRWGWVSSSLQVEGVASGADWSRWEASGRAPRSSDGNGFATNYRDDLGMLADWGFTDCRITVEWARIEPAPGKLDHDAVDHYSDMLRAARDAGLAPWAVLQNGTLPGWFLDDEGGYRDASARARYWPRHVDRCGEWFDGLVAGWTPIEDPTGWARLGYLDGSRPPGRRDERAALEATAGALSATAEAWRLLASGAPPVMGVFAAGDLDLWVPSLVEGELVDALDVVGLTVDATEPGQLGETLERVTYELGGRSFVIAGHGVDTGDDDWRDEVLRETVRQLEQALGDGIDVGGYFHDTAIDGYGAVSGLFARDRTPKESALRMWSAIRGLDQPRAR